MSQISIVCLVSALLSFMYVLSTSGSYRENQSSAWIPRWSYKKDVRFILILNTIFIFIYCVNKKFELYHTEHTSAAYYFLCFFVSTLTTVFLVRYITDVKKEAPSVWNQTTKE